MHTEQVALLSEHDELSQEIIDAKEKEIENLVENKVFQVVPNENQVCISSCCVITEKLKCHGKKMMKVCLVAKGYEEDSINMRMSSPTSAVNVSDHFLLWCHVWAGRFTPLISLQHFLKRK